MKKRIKVKALILAALLVVIAGVFIKLKANSRALNNERIGLAERYLENKYEQKMIYDHIESAGKESGGVCVYFHTETQPEIDFHVLVYGSDLGSESINDDVRKTVKDGYVFSRDTYFYFRFSNYVKKAGAETVEKIWPEDTEVKAYIENLHAVPENVYEGMSDEETEKNWNYELYIAVDTKDIEDLKGEAEKAGLYEKILETAENLVSYGLSPDSIIFAFYSFKEGHYDALMNDNYLDLTVDNPADTDLQEVIEDLVNNMIND
ncbi:MAG: hypothetical protein LUD81_11630 [Clostridiales bacterium]|nr:hypothetical protein [Clostridiales bacterium]